MLSTGFPWTPPCESLDLRWHMLSRAQGLSERVFALFCMRAHPVCMGQNPARMRAMSCLYAGTPRSYQGLLSEHVVRGVCMSAHPVCMRARPVCMRQRRICMRARRVCMYEPTPCLHACMSSLYTCACRASCRSTCSRGWISCGGLRTAFGFRARLPPGCTR